MHVEAINLAEVRTDRCSLSHRRKCMSTRVQIDKLAPTFIVGWAWNPDAPAACVSIQVRVGDQMVGSAIADGFRRDLLNANIGSGYHAFVIMFTRELTSDELNRLAIIILGAGESRAISLEHVSVDRSGLPPPAQPKSIGEQVRGLIKSVLRMQSLHGLTSHRCLHHNSFRALILNVRLLAVRN